MTATAPSTTIDQARHQHQRRALHPDGGTAADPPHPAAPSDRRGRDRLLLPPEPVFLAPLHGHHDQRKSPQARVYLTVNGVRTSSVSDSVRDPVADLRHLQAQALLRSARRGPWPRHTRSRRRSGWKIERRNQLSAGRRAITVSARVRGTSRSDAVQPKRARDSRISEFRVLRNGSARPRRRRLGRVGVSGWYAIVGSRIGQPQQGRSAPRPFGSADQGRTRVRRSAVRRSSRPERRREGRPGGSTAPLGTISTCGCPLESRTGLAGGVQHEARAEIRIVIWTTRSWATERDPRKPRPPACRRPVPDGPVTSQGRPSKPDPKHAATLGHRPAQLDDLALHRSCVPLAVENRDRRVGLADQLPDDLREAHVVAADGERDEVHGLARAAGSAAARGSAARWPLCGPRKPVVARAPPQARWMKVTEVLSSAFSSASAATAWPERPVRVQWIWS